MQGWCEPQDTDCFLLFCVVCFKSRAFSSGGKLIIEEDEGEKEKGYKEEE